MKHTECIKVVMRCRPLNKSEKDANYKNIVRVDKKLSQISIADNGDFKDESEGNVKKFTFDSVHGEESTQKGIYKESFTNIVKSVLSGFNGTVFAYGQTGTGKTYTMQGKQNDPDLMGIIPHSFYQIFEHIQKSENQQYLIRASYLEIYLEEIRDLLSKDQSSRLILKEKPDTGVYVKNLSSFVTKSVKEIDHVMKVGDKNRSFGATNMNEHSSRSHAIFIITIECSEMNPDDGEAHIRVGRLNLVDLAGSERQGKTHSEGDRLKEATKINLSLSALGNVISALVSQSTTHIPYRDSKLTRLLQDSLGGNSKTVMIANIGPASWNVEETLTTLRYANRAKNIKNKPKINENPKDALLREFKDEIDRLKSQLVKNDKPSKLRRKKEENSDEDELDDYMIEQREKLQKDRENIENDTSLIKEEKQKLINEQIVKEDELVNQQNLRDNLKSKIQNMESKLLQGGKNIVDHTKDQQEKLNERQRLIEQRKKSQEEIQKQIQEHQKSATTIHETYHSLQQEVDIKTKKLKKLYAQYQDERKEINRLTEEYRLDRNRLQNLQEGLTRQIKLKNHIIENFLLPNDVKDVTCRLLENSDGKTEDSWHLELQKSNEPQKITMSDRPMASNNFKRPTTQYSRMAGKIQGNPRYKDENIIILQLDMPTRTTLDFIRPIVDPQIQSALEKALNLEDESIKVDISKITSETKKKLKKEKYKVKEIFYPSSKGLIPK
ncbi:hypothetical protein A3Q56_05148 [Intoshia linei]|uniref:Kinesin-like protein n=1 Tax=Intoshia linei TaxID=1819745 RepID=A0A177B062_9BILA|nr:hypothetical protein A3Q56_05148 [Intoshia linei]